MNNFLTIKWDRPNVKVNYLSGSKAETSYGSSQVNNIHKMLSRTQNKKFKLHCLTDNPVGLNPEVAVIPIPRTGLDLINMYGGRYFKLYVFSKELQDTIKSDFMYMDLDVAITSDLSCFFQSTNLFTVMRGFRPNRLQWQLRLVASTALKRPLHFFQKNYFQKLNVPICKYNSSLMVIKRGFGNHIWKSFDPEISIPRIRENNLIGTDQAFLHLLDLDNVKTLWNKDGVWRFPDLNRYYQKQRSLPDNLKFVIFAGSPDLKPWITDIRKNFPFIQDIYPEQD